MLLTCSRCCFGWLCMQQAYQAPSIKMLLLPPSRAPQHINCKSLAQQAWRAQAPDYHSTLSALPLQKKFCPLQKSTERTLSRICWCFGVRRGPSCPRTRQVPRTSRYEPHVSSQRVKRGLGSFWDRFYGQKTRCRSWWRSTQWFR